MQSNQRFRLGTGDPSAESWKTWACASREGTARRSPTWWSVSWGCPNEAPQHGRCRQKLLFSHFWSLGVGDPGAGGAGSFRGPRENLLQPRPTHARAHAHARAADLPVCVGSLCPRFCPDDPSLLFQESRWGSLGTWKVGESAEESPAAGSGRRDPGARHPSPLSTVRGDWVCALRFQLEAGFGSATRRGQLGSHPLAVCAWRAPGTSPIQRGLVGKKLIRSGFRLAPGFSMAVSEEGIRNRVMRHIMMFQTRTDHI